MNKIYFFLGVATSLLVVSCAVRPAGAFQSSDVPRPPDYSDPAVWAALPFRKDSADVVPDSIFRDRQEEARVDVFFLYPTTYTGRRGDRGWNGDVFDANLNVRTDRTAIRHQASVFNGSCKVYAPRYRQAHLQCFLTRRHKEDGTRALALAYQDVRTAFQYYLEHYNNGRPLIIAAHSQGSLHASHLIREFYEDQHQMPPLIAAYLVGMPVEKDFFGGLSPCSAPDEIRCFCSWRTVHRKYRPNRLYPVGDKYTVTNPMRWDSRQEVAPKSSHLGAVFRKFYKGIYPGLVEAWVENGLLRVTRPKIPGVPILPTRNYHVADYNLFYANIRQNVADRIAAYFSSRQTGH
jgi:hypothetical protein